MSKVLVLDTHRRPLNPVHPGRARVLLSAGQAAVFRRYPFTIILNHEVSEPVEPLRLKIDPGSKTTGMVLVQGGTVVFAADIEHRGQRIRKALASRRSLRRSRRARKNRYLQARFLNRTRTQGWLPPSLESRVMNVETWVNRLSRLAPVSSISLELVKFDTQKLQNPEITGVEYQQGELFGYEIREYLLEKWGRKCAYCGAVNMPLEIEHIIPKSRGGSGRVSNLTLACNGCNQAKGNLTAGEFGHPVSQYYPGWLGYFVAFGIGYFSHVLADWVTTEGVPLFWPNRRRFRSPVGFRTGGPGELLFSLVAGTLLVTWLYRIFI